MHAKAPLTPEGRRDAPVDLAVEQLLARPVPGGRRALDVIVAAPKPVSVLLATERPDVARRVVALHERAVAAAHGYLVGEGVDGVPASRDALAVGFTHGVNRSLDPHLHTHVLVAARGPDGVPVDARSLRWRARSADALYLAALRDGLPEAAGRRAWVGRSGTTLVDGVDLGLVAATTTPRSRGGQLERGGQKRHPTRAEVRRRWDAQVASCPPIGAVAPPPGRTPAIDEHRFAAALGVGLVGHADVVRAWGAACTFGERPDRLRLAAALAAPELAAGARRPAVVVADAVGVRVLGARPRDPAALARWREGRAALGRYLEGGHRLGHLADPRGASSSTWLAVARLDAELAARGLRAGRGRDDRDVARGRSLS
ncbi:MAG TPA: relaxase domain-containing protein [Acidimicrobiales bacterium]|jgi:hypothetical protein|nr:relaxase domain-containing protein [Acidimicrobiales bacterium]